MTDLDGYRPISAVLIGLYTALIDRVTSGATSSSILPVGRRSSTQPQHETNHRRHLNTNPVRLVIAMDQTSTPAETHAAMTEHAARLRTLLEGFERAVLATRPPSGNWSAIENIRHALYAEQHHLGRFVPGGLGLSALGLPQGKYAAVTGIDPRTDLKAVFDEWERVHAAASAAVDFDQPRAADQLFRLWRHQQAHGRLAARALSEITGQTVRLPRPRSADKRAG